MGSVIVITFKFSVFPQNCLQRTVIFYNQENKRSFKKLTIQVIKMLFLRFKFKTAAKCVFQTSKKLQPVIYTKLTVTLLRIGSVFYYGYTFQSKRKKLYPPNLSTPLHLLCCFWFTHILIFCSKVVTSYSLAHQSLKIWDQQTWANRQYR